jgi:hypothetical protein
MESCDRCGKCCEILPTLVFGKECEHFDKKERSCMIYENRPEICRVKDWSLSKPFCEVLKGMRL